MFIGEIIEIIIIDLIPNHKSRRFCSSTRFNLNIDWFVLRLGIETPKKDGPLKTWTEDSLNVALDALRTGSISANKASKAYGTTNLLLVFLGHLCPRAHCYYGCPQLDSKITELGFLTIEKRDRTYLTLIRRCFSKLNLAILLNYIGITHFTELIYNLYPTYEKQ